MDKEIFTAICERISQKLPELKYIEEDEGQLNVSERPPVAFPCCLIEVNYQDCDDVTKGIQKVQLHISLKIAFNIKESTNINAPANVRERALKRLDTTQNIYKALQGWRNNGMFLTMKRKQEKTEKRGDGLKVYNCLYMAEIMEKI